MPSLFATYSKSFTIVCSSTSGFEYVANKLGISVNELQSYFDGPNKTFRDYKNKNWIIELGAYALKIIGQEKRLYK